LFVSMTPAIAVRLTILAACLAAAAVVIVAIVRTPSPRRIAAVADARLRLEDCLVTALQYADDPDAVSRLVVRDATSRLAGGSPAHVFPFRVPAWIGWVAVVTITASAILTLTGRNTSFGVPRRPAASSGAGVTAAAAVPNGSVQAGDAASSGPTSRNRASSHAGPAPARDPGNTQGADGAGDRGKAPGARPDTSASRAPRSEDGRRSAAAAAPAAVTPAADVVTPLAPRALSASNDLGSAGGVASRGQTAASGAGGVSSRGTASGSEGTPRTGGEPPRDARPDTHDARYAAARARAEAALGGERIPPGLRAYLTAYFTAINRDSRRTER
jgi:hypothetical protein